MKICNAGAAGERIVPEGHVAVRQPDMFELFTARKCFIAVGHRQCLMQRQVAQCGIPETAVPHFKDSFREIHTAEIIRVRKALRVNRRDLQPVDLLREAQNIRVFRLPDIFAHGVVSLQGSRAVILRAVEHHRRQLCLRRLGRGLRRDLLRRDLLRRSRRRLGAVLAACRQQQCKCENSSVFTESFHWCLYPFHTVIYSAISETGIVNFSPSSV